jgi:hypothetical protein
VCFFVPVSGVFAGLSFFSVSLLPEKLPVQVLKVNICHPFIAQA